MLFYLFLLFTVVPILELTLLVWIGTETQWWVPVVVVITTGMAGAALWRQQGLRIIQRIQGEMAAGQMPADALVDALLIFLAGAFLITPGVITDAIGVALLVPPIRAVVKRLAKLWFLRHVQVRTAAFYPNGTTPGGPTNGESIRRIQDYRCPSHRNPCGGCLTFDRPPTSSAGLKGTPLCPHCTPGTRSAS